MNESTALAQYSASTAMQQAIGGNQGGNAPVVPIDRDSLQFYASMITSGGLIPEDKTVPAEVSKSRVMAKIVSGASYCFDPVLSQSCYDILFNRLVLNAHAMEILFRDTGEYDTRVTYLEEDACRVDVIQQVNGTWDVMRNRLVGGTWHKIGEVEFTNKMAEDAKLPSKNANWASFRRDMLYSKVMKRVVKRYNPGCLRPRVLLGQWFAKAHQPQAPAAPIETVQSVPQMQPAPNDAQVLQSPIPQAPAVAPIPQETYPTYPTYPTADREKYVPTLVMDGDDDGVEAVIVETKEVVAEPVTQDEAKLIDMRAAVSELLVQKVGGMPNDQKRFLKGKVIANESLETLQGMYAELEGM